MCRKTGKCIFSHSVSGLRVLLPFLSLSLFLMLFPVSGVSSQQPSPLWSTLKLSIDSFPKQIADYNQSLQTQLDSLNSKLTSSQLSVTNLLKGNKTLQDSNKQLLQQAETSRVALERLQMDLTNSTTSITRAQSDLAVIEAQNRFLKISLSVVVGGLSAYLAGHYIFRIW